MKRAATLILLLVCMLGLICPAHAAPSSNAGGHGAENKQKKSAQNNKGSHGSSSKAKGHNDDGTDILIRATITVATAREIAVQGGWIGYQPLPPGIAKNLARGKPLPPGIAKKVLPGNMLKKLPSYPGYEWGVLGNDLVLYRIAGMVIADILYDVFH